MKKIFSFFAALLFAGTMMAAEINCSAVYSLAKNDAAELNPVTVTYLNGANVYVKDASASLLLYLPKNTTVEWKAGDVLTGVAGTVDIYNGLYEVKPSADQVAAVTVAAGEAPAPEELTAAPVDADMNKYVIFKGVSVEGEFTTASKTNLTATIGEETFTLRNNFQLAQTFVAGKTYNIIGAVAKYNANMQVYFISAEEETPIIGGPEYYLVGSKIGWEAQADYKLAKNPEVEGEWTIDYTAAAEEGLKVLGVEGDTKTWYKDGMGNEYVVSEAGDYTVKFRPAGNPDWSYTYFTLVKKEEPAEVSCADVYSLEKGANVDLNPVTVTYLNGANVYVKDASASLLLYLPKNTTVDWKAGDVLTGVAGTVDIYNGLYEVKPSADQVAAVTVAAGEAPAPEELTAAPVDADMNKYVIFKGVSVEGEFTTASKTNLTATIGEETFTLRNNFQLAQTFVAGKTYNIIGAVAKYNANMQVYFISAEEETPIIDTDTLTCAAAVEAAAAGSTAEVYVKGYVTEIAYAWKDGSMSFWMADAKDGGRVFEAYKCAIADQADAVRVGDLVKAHGTLTKYNTTYELAAGCTVEILERAPEPKNLGEKTIAEFLALANKVDTCVLTGVVDSIKNNTYGNLYMSDETGSLYVYGVLTPAGESKKFADLDVTEGDTLTIKAIYNLYNDAPQAKNAIFVSVAKKQIVPTGDTIAVEISSIITPGALNWTDAVASEGWWQIMGATEDYEFSLSNVSTTETAGVYTIDDLDPDYSYITVMTATDTTDVAFVDGSVTVAIDEAGVVTIVGDLLGDDGNVYSFNLTYKDPTPETTVAVTIAGNLDDTYGTYGLYAVYGYAEDGTYVQLAIWTEGDFEGKFTKEDLDFQIFGSGIMDATGVQNIFSADIEVIPGDAEGVYLVKADLLCYNNTLYKVTMKIGEDPQGINNVDAAAKAVKALRNGILVIEKNNVQYNVNGAVIR